MGKTYTDFLSMVRHSIVRRELFGKNSKILTAVSGGMDSMSLIEALIGLKNDFNLNLAVAHVNYMLRGSESDGDEQLVRDYSIQNKLPIFVKKVKKEDYERSTGSFQQRARSIRYGYFEHLRIKHGFDYIATGHNADDNAETVLLHLLRGSGPDGLRGIPAKRDRIVRPLIDISREEIKKYVHEANIQYRTDSSNSTGLYARNIVRNELFPLIRLKLRENIQDSINRTSEIVGWVDDYVGNEARKQSKAIITATDEREFFIAKNDLRSLHPVIAGYVIRDAAAMLCGKPISFQITRRIQSLIDSPAGISVMITHKYRAVSESAGIRFLESNVPEHFFADIELDEEYRFDDFTFRSSFTNRDRVSFDTNKNVEFIDADTIRKPVVLRYWMEGDRIQPLGMQTQKKVSDVFTDAKIPRTYKHRIPVLATPDGIVWLCGLQLDNRYKITDNTQRILKIEYISHAPRKYNRQ
jgi:tRNA(Ile)-lysidine synthase